MFRLLLPVVICTSASITQAQTCELIPGSADSCVRVLACIGDDGLFVDGGAYGWDSGTLDITRSDGITCEGSWDSDGPLGTGLANFSCTDGVTGDVIYYSQDNGTGTAIGRGVDSTGRDIQAWSGENVLEYLSETGEPEAARLPCSPATLLLG